ncbi:hypothetical protein Pmani_023229 [Petrolisthes manimaculis]|uniref:Methyltransferase FkbM domain-containing protein n=1 Tax=Petrolisthes manimaculis TaxID=1843537 RepID=A0AAE1PCB9_9EUCA|nr:hypothetical protein Pmani_023229 [Petrolisthes manimaculis]
MLRFNRTKLLAIHLLLTTMWVLVWVLVVLVWPGQGRHEGRDEEILTVTNRMMGPLSYDDPTLLGVVVKSFLHPPSTKTPTLMADQYNHQALKYMNYKAEFSYMFCQKVIKELFNDVRGGFFVEAGALDGEFLSNTLHLELKADWTGLLVEADGDMFNQLLKKRRRVWASHSCLAIHPHPHKDVLRKFLHYKDLNNEFAKQSARAHGSLVGISGMEGSTLNNAAPGHQLYEGVQCLPLATLLLALNVSRVDLVSLDVEGAEDAVLRHFPWGRITVDVWIVEHMLPKPTTSPATQTNTTPPSTSNVTSHEHSMDAEFVSMFESHGYDLYTFSKKLFIPNYVFILRNSKYHRAMNKL